MTYMKSILMMGLIAVLALAPQARGQVAFNSGSTGADGALEVATDTVKLLPPNGLFNYTTVHVAAGATLTFTRNVHNTPVYILAQGDIKIEGTIDVSGFSGTTSPPVPGGGGPGGFSGGSPGILGVAPGAGQGPGAGLGGSNAPGYAGGSAGAGAYGTRPVNITETDGFAYGSALLVPLVGGSGGGGTSGQPGRGGAGGGGAILLSSSTKVEIFGAVKAIGGNNTGNSPASLQSGGQGSGGAIRCVAPIVSGTGTLDVLGGYTNHGGVSGGDGRIRIDSIFRNQLAFNYSPSTAVSIGAYMASFASPQPRLDIINVAGKVIPEGTSEAVSIFMPLGTQATQTITLQARDFLPGTVVPVRLQLTPQEGDPTSYDDTIDMSQGNPATKDIQVVIPGNTLTFIHAWTR